MAGTPLPLDQGIFDSNFGTVLDSGTTYAYFPDKAFKAFTTAVSFCILKGIMCVFLGKFDKQKLLLNFRLYGPWYIRMQIVVVDFSKYKST